MWLYFTFGFEYRVLNIYPHWSNKKLYNLLLKIKKKSLKVWSTWFFFRISVRLWAENPISFINISIKSVGVDGFWNTTRKYFSSWG